MDRSNPPPLTGKNTESGPLRKETNRFTTRGSPCPRGCFPILLVGQTNLQFHINCHRNHSTPPLSPIRSRIHIFIFAWLHSDWWTRGGTISITANRICWPSKKKRGEKTVLRIERIEATRTERAEGDITICSVYCRVEILNWNGILHYLIVMKEINRNYIIRQFSNSEISSTCSVRDAYSSRTGLT